jgi:hypothetical protein
MNCPGALATGLGSPAQGLASAENRSHWFVGSSKASSELKVGMERFLAKADIVLPTKPRAKAPGQFI